MSIAASRHGGKAASARLCKAKATCTKTKDTPDGFLSLLSSFTQGVNSAHGAGAPSPPSEEGGGTAYKGLKRRDGRRDTLSVCESSRYRRVQSQNDTCITSCTPTPWCKQQLHVLSPSVAPLNPLGAPAPSSEGAEGAEAAAAARHKFAIVRYFAFRIPNSPNSLIINES